MAELQIVDSLNFPNELETPLIMCFKELVNSFVYSSQDRRLVEEWEGWEDVW